MRWQYDKCPFVMLKATFRILKPMLLQYGMIRIRTFESQ